MELVELYKALADRSRLRLLNALRHGQLNVQEITSVLELTQPTVSHHLKVLQSVKLVHPQREGTWMYYQLNHPLPGRSQEQPDPTQSQAQELLASFLALSPSNGVAEQFAIDNVRTKNIIDKRRDQSRRFFDEVAPSWRALREMVEPSFNGVSTLELFCAQIPTTGDLLELGCGSGALLERIIPRQGKTIAVDYSPSMIDEAKRVLATKGERASEIDLRLGYLEHIPVADSSVDLVVGYMVFHHLSTPIEAITDAARTLRDGGEIIIADLIQHSDETMRERFSDLWLGFPPEQFCDWLHSAGFEKVRTEPWGKAFLVRGRKSPNTRKI